MPDGTAYGTLCYFSFAVNPDTSCEETAALRGVAGWVAESLQSGSPRRAP